MNNFRIVLKNTFILTVSELFLKIIGFLWVVFLAHTLSVELYGRYNLVNSFIAIFSFLPDMGVGLILIREIAKNRKKAPIYLGNSFLLNGLLAIFTVFVITAMSFILNYPTEVKYLMGIASLTLFLSTIRSVGVVYFEGIEQMQVPALLNSFNTVITLAFACVGLLLGFGLAGVFWGMLLGTIISLTVTWVNLKRVTFPVFQFDQTLIKHLFFEGMPLGLAAFAALIYMRIDTIMLNQFLGERSVGIYNSATPFVFGLIQLLNVPFMGALFPTLTRLSKENTGRFVNATKKSLLVIAFWSIPIAIGVSLFSQIIPLVFGAKYAAAVPVLRIAIFVVPFASLSALLYKILIVLHRQKVYLFISICGAVASAILNLILIPKFGVEGAAMASVSTQGILFVIYMIVVFSYLRKLS